MQGMAVFIKVKVIYLIIFHSNRIIFDMDQYINIMYFQMRVFFFIMLSTLTAWTQSVGIGTVSPHSSAVLEISSDQKGVLIPRLTEQQRNLIVNPANGLMLYNQTNQKYNFYKNGEWHEFVALPKGSVILSRNRNDSLLISEGFRNDGFIYQDYIKTTYADTIIPAFQWYEGNLSSYQNEDAPGFDNISSYDGQNLYVFTTDSVYYYKPINDLWHAKPIPEQFHEILSFVIRSGTVVWTGSEFILWGGKKCVLPLSSGCFQYALINKGVKYQPTNDEWSLTSELNAPTKRENHKALWTGNKMFIWGGNNSDNPLLQYNTGGLYDPINDEWTPLPIPSNFEGRTNFVMDKVESNLVLIWGGKRTVHISKPIENPCYSGQQYNIVYDSIINCGDGKIYNLTANVWTDISPQNAPLARYNHTGLLVPPYGYVIAGGTYSLDNGFYCANCTSPPFPPSPCVKHDVKDSILNTAIIYDVNTNSWIDVFDLAPFGFHQADAIWDNNQFVNFFSLDSVLSLEISTGEWMAGVLPQHPVNSMANPVSRKFVWPYFIPQGSGLPELVLFARDMSNQGRQKVFNYRTTPVTLSKLKNSDILNKYKLYLYVKM